MKSQKPWRHANTVGGQPVFELFATQTDQKPEARRTVDRAMSPFFTKTDFEIGLDKIGCSCDGFVDLVQRELPATVMNVPSLRRFIKSLYVLLLFSRTAISQIISFKEQSGSGRPSRVLMSHCRKHK